MKQIDMTHPANNRITFAELLESEGNLEKIASGYRAHFVLYGKETPQDFTVEEVAAYDARLPQVFDAIIAQEHNVKGSSIPRVFVDWINRTLTHWTHPVQITLPTGYEFYISKIDAIRKYPAPSGGIELSVECYQRPHVLEGADGIEYVKGVSYNDVVIPYAELEKYYPGWKVRMDLLSQLSTSRAELLADVFQAPSPVRPANLQGLDFD